MQPQRNRARAGGKGGVARDRPRRAKRSGTVPAHTHAQGGCSCPRKEKLSSVLLSCLQLCVCIRWRARAAVPTESPTHRLGTVGGAPRFPRPPPQAPRGRPQRSVIFSRSRVSIYRRMKGEGASGVKKGEFSSPARQSLDHVDEGPASSRFSCEAFSCGEPGGEVRVPVEVRLGVSGRARGGEDTDR